MREGRLKKSIEYFRRRKLFLLVFFVVVAVSILIAFRSNEGMILFSDSNFFMFIDSGTINNSYVWNDNNQFGLYNFNNIIAFPFILLFKAIANISNIYIASNIYFFGLYAGLFLSSIYLVNSIDKKRDFLDYPIVATYALANPLIFSLFSQIDMAYSLVFVNLFLASWFRIKGLIKVRDIFILSITVLFCNFYIQTTLLLFSVIVLYLVFLKFKEVITHKKLFFSAVAIFIFLNMFWLVFAGYQLINGQTVNQLMNYDSFSEQGIGIVKSMSSTIKAFSPFILSHYYETKSAGLLYFYSNIYAILVLLGVFLFIISSIFLYGKKINRRSKKLILFLLTIYFIFFIFSLGNKEYFGNFFMFFWNHFPLFNLYRSIHKFLFPLYFISLILFALGLNRIRGRRNVKIAVLILILPLALAFYQKDFLRSINNYKLPEYYLDFSNKATNDMRDVITKIIPETNWYVKFDWNPNGNDSGNVLPVLINNKRTSYNYARYVVDTREAKTNDEINTALMSCMNNSDIGRFLGFMNIGRVLLQRDVRIEEPDRVCSQNIENSHLEKYQSFGQLDLYRLDEEYLLPHFYTPKKSIISQRTFKDLPKIVSGEDWQIRSAVFFANQNVGKEGELEKLKAPSSPPASPAGRQPSPRVGDGKNSLQLSSAGEGAINAPCADEGGVMSPTLEFKKINPTKYRVRVHGASGVFPLVFSESFHDGWKAYLASPENFKFEILNLKSKRNDEILNYKVLDGNSEDQATADELQDAVDQGYVTTLGDGKEKVIEHKKWDGLKEQTDYVEKYNIDFVSKNFQGTIQNDNLPAGNIFETWLQKPIENNANHLIVNGYANSWVIDTNLICNSAPSSPPPSPRAGEGVRCIQNPDGTYDFELVVEFWPQRLFYIGLGISGLTLLGCIAYLGYDYRKRKKSKNLDQKIY